jgi:hypothetical protein
MNRLSSGDEIELHLRAPAFEFSSGSAYFSGAPFSPEEYAREGVSRFCLSQAPWGDVGHSFVFAQATAPRPNRERLLSPSGAWFDETGLIGEDHRVNAVAQIQLCEYVRDMRLDGGLANDQLFCDLGVRHPARE